MTSLTLPGLAGLFVAIFALGMIGGVLFKNFLDRSTRVLLHQMLDYHDRFRVYSYVPFSHDTIYLVSFNGGTWFYQLHVGQDGRLIDCKGVTISKDEATRLRLGGRIVFKP